MAERSANFSFEFFPPKTAEGEARLQQTLSQLAPLCPSFFSVTFGAGGSTRDGTLATVQSIMAQGHAAAPHLSCIGSTKESIRALLAEYRRQGVQRIVALRGDMPSGMVEAGEFRYASELVRFIREEHGDHFHIEVAAYPEFHPQARSAEDDLQHFVNKMQAGADSAITQYFFNTDAYFRFVDQVRARGIARPVVPGIMPISNFSQLCRFSDACGTEIPRWLRLRMQSYADDTASVRALGLDVVTQLCERLLQAQVPGLHFYTLNQAALVTAIWQRLGL